MKILVTGGAGFIGSHLIDTLIEQKNEIFCVDDLSLGSLANIQHLNKSPKFRFLKLDLNDIEHFLEICKTEKFDQVFHMAANSDIQLGSENPNVDLSKTFMTTFSVLDCMRRARIKKIVFASTSAIYGDLGQKLHEDIGPLFPVSLYGAAKLASESFISGFAEIFDMQAWIFRFPNVVGFRSTHGAIFDFIKKLRANPAELQILGDGKQAKPYLYVQDLVDGMLWGWKKSNEKINFFNLGVNSTTSVTEIAQAVVEEMDLKNVVFAYTGGEKGWKGDVPRFEYDTSKINSLGWWAKRSSTEAVRLAIQAELKHQEKKS